MLRILSLLYAASALWCVAWLTQGDPNESGFFLPATVLAVLAVPIAIGLMMKKRAAFIMLYVHVAAWLVIGLAIATFIKTHREFLYFALGHTVLVSLLFLPPRVRGLFFASAKAMRTATRQEIHLQSFVEVDGNRKNGETVDLSQTGAYISVPVEGFAVGQRVFVQMHLRANKFLRLPAHIKSVNAEGTEQYSRGIGVQWSHLQDHDKEGIAHFMSEGKRMNQLQTPLKLRGSFVWNNADHTCDLYGLTTEGCYLDDQEHVLQPGDQVSLVIHLYEGDTIEVLSEVKWLPGDATIVAVTNIIGSALEFRDLSKRDAQRISERIAVK